MPRHGGLHRDSAARKGDPHTCSWPGTGGEGMNTDLQIRIFAPSEGRCRVEAQVDGTGRFDGEAVFDLNALRERQGEPAAYGQLLRDALFASRPLQRAYQLHLR